MWLWKAAQPMRRQLSSAKGVQISTNDGMRFTPLFCQKFMTLLCNGPTFEVWPEHMNKTRLMLYSARNHQLPSPWFITSLQSARIRVSQLLL